MTPKNKKDDQNSSEGDTQEHLALVQEILENTQASIKSALALIKDKNVDPDELLDSLKGARDVSGGNVNVDTGNSRIVEGVFNGEKMIGGDGVEYNVPANYASKSKLVEGDILKLTITGNGSFLYKQIGPVERTQLVTDLAQSETGEWYAVQGRKKWKLLTASVTYFHGDAGDEVVILIPQDGKTAWAAVENVIRSKK